MAVVDFSVALSSRFSCPQPVDASPANKTRHLVASPVSTRAPHCVVGMQLGTFGTGCDRTDVNFYTGHVPDAPVLLGAQQAAIYRAGIATCGLSGRRVLATATAAAIGACVGAACTVGAVGIVALAHLAAPALVLAVNVRNAVQVAIISAALFGVVLGVMEIKEWNGLRGQLSALHAMCQHAEKKGADAQKAVASGLHSESWAVQQAALELEGHLAA